MCTLLCSCSSEALLHLTLKHLVLATIRAWAILKELMEPQELLSCVYYNL